MSASVMPVEDLETSVRRSLQSKRPLLHHLNADTSWLLQLPVPSTARTDDSASAPTKRWFNILIDPWLSGPQSDVASWFSTQWHSIEPAVPSIAKLRQLIRQTESYSGSIDLPDASQLDQIDLVLISHEFTDHMHQQTLLEIDGSVPVFATAKAANTIQKWKHFTSVQETPPFVGNGVDWRQNRRSPLPEWISVSRIVNETDALYYHSALLVAFVAADKETAEAVIYTPHGIDAACLQSVAEAQPPLRTLAFLHGLHAVQITKQQLNLGAHNGLRAQRMLNSPYWVATHDEEKSGRGFVGWLLKRQRWSIHDALRDEQAKNGKEQSLADANFFELKNGQVAVLA